MQDFLAKVILVFVVCVALTGFASQVLTSDRSPAAVAAIEAVDI